MRVKVPAMETVVCDYCHRSGYLETCPVCKKEFCISCKGMMFGCFVNPDVCDTCSKREDVKAVIAQAAKNIAPIIQKRSQDLNELAERGEL